MKGAVRMKKLLTRNVQELFQLSNPEARSSAVQDAEFAKLPLPVQRYLRFTGISGKPWIQTIRLKQRGRFRMNENQGWVDLEAEEYFTVDPPGFVWYGKLKPFPLVNVEGIDRFYAGNGHFLIKMVNLITLVDASGPELDESELLRYLSEVIWFPSAFLSETITWEAINSESARATIRVGELSASAEFVFDEEGRMINLHARRHRSVDDGFELAEWSTPVERYGEMNGIQIPVQARAEWNLETGDFPYFDGGITQIEYNVPLQF
jgi:hypothetical protein